MQLSIEHRSIELIRGDIVTQDVDAIVNAANTRLLGGGGVDGAIHRAAGPELLEACRALPVDAGGRRCATGDVRVTPGFRLPARFVIHGVGPVYDSAHPERSAELLHRVHARALAAAEAQGCRSVAFPAISTGVYGYPVDEAAGVALDAARTFLATAAHSVEVVRFVLFSDADLRAFEQAARALDDGS